MQEKWELERENNGHHHHLLLPLELLYINLYLSYNSPKISKISSSHPRYLGRQNYSLYTGRELSKNTANTLVTYWFPHKKAAGKLARSQLDHSVPPLAGIWWRAHCIRGFLPTWRAWWTPLVIFSISPGSPRPDIDTHREGFLEKIKQ